MRRWDLLSVELAGDLTQTPAGAVLGPDALDDAGGERGWPPRICPALLSLSSRPASFRKQALQLVDRDLSGSPRHLDRLDQGQDASVEGGAADTERFRRLRACVGEALDAGRLADDLARRGRRRVERRRVTLCLLTLASQSTS